MESTRSELQTWMEHVLELDIERDVSFQDGPTFADFLFRARRSSTTS